MRKFCFCLFICFFLFACNSTSVDLTPPVVTKVKPILATAFVTPTTSATKTTTVTLVPKKTPDQPQQHIAGLRMFDVVNEGWIWTDDNDIHHFFHVTNGGKIWKEIKLDGTIAPFGAFFLDANHAWLSVYPNPDYSFSQIIYRTTDGGQTWDHFPAPPGANFMFDFYDSQLGWLMDSEGLAGSIALYIFQTKDGGETWNHLTITDPNGLALPGDLTVQDGGSLTFRLPETIWITSGFINMTSNVGWVSRDEGKDWKKFIVPLPSVDIPDQSTVRAEAPQFVSDRDVYLPVTVGQKIYFFISHNDGETWVLLPSVLERTDMYSSPNVQFVSPKDGFAVCDVKLCVTHDGAQTWQIIPSDYPFAMQQGGSYVSQFDFVNANMGWAVLLDQNGHTSLIQTLDGGKTWMTIHS